jgi:hypothetical protein
MVFGLGAGNPIPLNTFPLSIGSPICWMNGSLGVLTDSSGNVNTWLDLTNSGNGCVTNTFTRPVFHTGGQNGYPYLSFNGSQGLAGQTNALSSQGNGFEIAIIFSNNSGGNGNALYNLLNSGSGMICDINSAGKLQCIGQSPSTHVLTASTALTNTIYMTDCCWNGTSSYLYVTGSGSTTGSLAPFTASEGYPYWMGNDGASGGWIGNIYEVVMYGLPLTTGQRTSLTSYFTTKYGVSF